MASEKSIKVVICGKVYTLTGYEEEEYLTRVASYITRKNDELNAMDGIKTLSSDMKATLLEINVADDYFKARAHIETLEADMEQRDKEIYSLKHELISAQLKAETLEETIAKLEAENKELLLNKAKLEASLEDALLGSLGSDD